MKLFRKLSRAVYLLRRDEDFNEAAMCIRSMELIQYSCVEQVIVDIMDRNRTCKSMGRVYDENIVTLARALFRRQGRGKETVASALAHYSERVRPQ